MKVYIVSVCVDSEYGFCELWGVFSTAEKAHEEARFAGFQNTDIGDDYDFRTNYYEVEEREVDAPRNPNWTEGWAVD